MEIIRDLLPSNIMSLAITEKKIQEEALKIASEVTSQVKQDQIPSGFALFGASWHQGVSGIVASRVKDIFNRPVIVFANDKDVDFLLL